MTKLNPDHSRYAGADTTIEYSDIVTRGKASTLWEVVETEYPNRVRLSRLGSYGETNAWADSDQLHFVHRTQFPGYSSCQHLIDTQDAIRELTAGIREDTRYVRRVSMTTVDQASVLDRKVTKLKAAVAEHRAVLADVYGVREDKA